MKNENELISIDEFRLQLNQLDILEKEYKREEIVEEEAFIYKFQELPMSISSVESWVYFTLHLAWLLHLVFIYINAFANIYGTSNVFVSLKDILVTYVELGVIVNGIMVGIIFLAILFPKTRKDPGIVFILDYIGSETYPYLRYIIDFVFYSSAFFAISATLSSLIVFGLACLASMIQTTLLQNLTLRKGQFCCKSVQYAILWRLAVILSLVISIIGISAIDSSTKLVLWTCGQTVIGIVVMVCYYSFGVYIYRNKVPRLYFFFLNSSFLAIAIAIFFDSIQSQNHHSMNLALQGPLFLIIVGFFNWSTLERKRRISICPENTNIKEKVYFFFNKFEQIDVDQEDDCEVRGVLSYHFAASCPNKKCVANLKEVYDSKKKKYCSTSKIGQSRVSLIKFYVKCLYERALENDPQNVELRLDYVQFYYLKLKNIFQVLQQIQILQTKLLSPFQKLRLVRLKKLIKKQCNSFSQELYLHNLSMEKTLECESIFQNIQKNMDLVLQRNELFWKYIERNEVFLGDIFDTIRPNFELVDRLNQDWTQLADYFSINRRWKFYFLCFSIFIKNQKLKPAAIQDFGNSVEYDTIFRTGNQFIDKTSEKESLYNPIVLFEQNTSYLSVICDQEKMLIKKVSKYFQRNFDHEPRHLLNTSLDVLLPPSIRIFHHSMFLSWVREGKTNNDQCYPIREILPLTSRGFLAPCFKFYKYYLRTEGEVEYIAMLKRNRNDEMLILANEDFQVEAITYSLSQKLKITEDDYCYFRGLSLLALMPVLPKYTRFAKYIADKDEDFMENDDNQIYYRKQSTFAKAHNQNEIDIIGLKKELNLTNLKILMPTDLQEACANYMSLKKHQKEKKSSEFQVIRECYQNTMRSKRYLKFRGQMYIREKTYPAFTNKKYYELEINQLQENNRLEKLKMEDVVDDGKSSEAAHSSQEIQNQSLASFNEVDVQLFMQLNKKKNKVVLFPSKNIFLKDENNQLLAQIRHISNISLSVRFIVIIFVCILLAILAVEVALGGQISHANEEYHIAVNNQKSVFLLNTQYNLQHVQPGNYQEEAFFILYYSNLFLTTMASAKFQGLLYQTQLNPSALIQPFYPDPYPYYPNVTCLPLDQVSIFRKMREQIITLRTLTELDATQTLEVPSFHIFSNYLPNFYNHTQTIKQNIANKQQKLSALLQQVIFILGIIELVLIVVCFLFILSRLLKVTNGFSELLSIFIQMDNMDIKKILKYMEYVQHLFNHLRSKYQKMSQNNCEGKTGTASQNQFDKFSTQQGKEEQVTSNTNANLNKKLKKIDLGSQIKGIQMKTIGLTVAFLVLVGLSLFVPVIFSTVAHNQLDTLKNIGHQMMINNSISNYVVSGVVSKFRNASFYNYSQYQSFLSGLSVFTKSSTPILIAGYNNVLSNLLHKVYFQNFVVNSPQILNQTLTTQIDFVCKNGRLNSSICAYLKANITTAYYTSRVNTIQHQQLIKGALSFYNYLINRYGLFFNNINPVSTNDVYELTEGYNILAIYEIHLMNLWLTLTSEQLSNILVQMIIITCLTICLILVFHLVFVEFLIVNTLNSNYERFRRMYENLIPEFVINKEKIIKAKLIKEGFMIE